MRVAIVTTQCPFVTGGAELHARNLERALRAAGHEAEIVSMPFKWYPPETVLDHILAAPALDISEFNGVKIDLAIGLKFPAYLMRHPNKILWVLHQHRQAYDLWDSGVSDLFNHPIGQAVRDAVRAADDQAFSGVQALYANSANVAGRLQRYNGVEAQPLYHPPPLASRLSPSPVGDYLYYPSRLVSLKRQDLVLRALAEADPQVRVVFSGGADNPDYGAELRRLAAELGVEDRVQWRGYVSDEEMARLYEGARAVLFTPVDEDLGYVTFEAMLAGRPVITLTDAGEPAALVRHEVEGLVAGPEAAALGAAMSRLAGDRALAEAMGQAGVLRYRALDISWEHVVQTLTGAPPEELCIPGLLRPRPSPPPSPPDLIETGLEMLRQAFPAGGPRRVLEIGAAEPYPFTALMRQAFPEAEFTVAQASPEGVRWTHRCAPDGKGAFDIHVAGLNVETTPLPFADHAFDLVVMREALERFCIDPGFVFREVRRVLGPEGAFLVSTPNLVSLEAIARSLEGQTPYADGRYTPGQGIHGRHNREFTPGEVEALGRYAGFETETTQTRDVSAQDAPPALLDYLRRNDLPTAGRGRHIFWLGRARGGGELGPTPPSLFAVEPSVFSARLAPVAGTDPDILMVRATNTGPKPWTASGPGRIRLSLDRTDQDGRVGLDVLAVDLPHDVGPGASAEVAFQVARGGHGDGAWHEIGLFAEGAGPLKGAGRANTVRIFAERIAPQGR